MTTPIRDNHLAHPMNKRIVQAIEFVNQQEKIERKHILAKIGYHASSYNKVKSGERSVPHEKYTTIALVLSEYGIRPEWLLYGRGDMEKPKGMVNEDMLMVELLREELAIKQSYIEELERENARLRAGH